MIKNLIEIGLALGLSNRADFVKEVSGFVEKYKASPEEAEVVAQRVTTYLEELKDDWRIQRNITNSVADSMPTQQIEQLTKAINDLTKQLQQKK